MKIEFTKKTVRFMDLSSGTVFTHNEFRTLWMKVHDGKIGAGHFAVDLEAGGSWRIDGEEKVAPCHNVKVVFE